MSTSQALLGLLETAPSYGYALKHRYDEQFPHAKPLAFGQVYAALARFEKRGLAEVSNVEAGAGPDRRRYVITNAGVSAVDEWVTTPETATSYSSSALFAKLSIALLSGRDATAVLADQRAAHVARMRELTAARRDAGPTALLAIIFELGHLDADLKWIVEAGARLGILAASQDETGENHG